MKRSNNKIKTHDWILNRLPESSCVLDMTCGNGYDTYFLAKHCQEVIAIDIQGEAIQTTQKHCQGFKNISYYNIDHSQLSLNKPYTGAIYNLGYLPNSDKKIITQPETTLRSIKNILPFLTHFLVITTYRKHEGGLTEHKAVQHYLESLNTTIEVLSYDTPLSPVTFLVDLTS